jgi:hypothetical protein
VLSDETSSVMNSERACTFPALPAISTSSRMWERAEQQKHHAGAGAGHQPAPASPSSAGTRTAYAAATKLAKQICLSSVGRASRSKHIRVSNSSVRFQPAGMVIPKQTKAATGTARQ